MKSTTLDELLKPKGLKPGAVFKVADESDEDYGNVYFFERMHEGHAVLVPLAKAGQARIVVAAADVPTPELLYQLSGVGVGCQEYQKDFLNHLVSKVPLIEEARGLGFEMMYLGKKDWYSDPLSLSVNHTLESGLFGTARFEEVYPFELHGERDDYISGIGFTLRFSYFDLVRLEVITEDKVTRDKNGSIRVWGITGDFDFTQRAAKRAGEILESYGLGHNLDIYVGHRPFIGGTHRYPSAMQQMHVFVPDETSPRDAKRYETLTQAYEDMQRVVELTKK